MRNITFEKLTLKNFQVHEDMDLDFKDNKFMVISGPNGSGKSTIFDGLLWTLYDKTAKGLGGDDIVRVRSGKDTSGEISFKIDNDIYKIQNFRKHKKKKNNKYLFKNEKDISCSTRSETNNLIEQLIMPFEIFQNCLLFSQFAKGSFTKLGHSNQKDILDSLIGLTQYDKYREQTIQTIKDLEIKQTNSKLKLNNINSEISFYQNSLEESTRDKENVRVSHNNYILSKKKEIENLKKNLVDEKNVLERLDVVSNTIIDITTQKHNIQTKIDEQIELYNNEISIEEQKLKNKYDLEKSKIENKYKDKSSNLNEKITSFKNKANQIKFDVGSKIEENKNRINQILIEIDKYETSVDRKFSNVVRSLEESCKDQAYPIEEKLNKLKLKASDLKQTSKNNRIKIEELNKKIEELEGELKKPNPKCPVCNQLLKSADSITHINKELQTSRNQIIHIDREISEIELNISNVQKEYHNLEEKLSKGYEKLNESIKAQTELKDNQIKKNKIEKDLEINKIELENKEINEEANSNATKINEEIDIINQEVDKLVKIKNEELASLENNNNTEKNNIISTTKSKYRKKSQEWIDHINNFKNQIELLDKEKIELSGKIEIFNEIKTDIHSFIEQIKFSEDKTKESEVELEKRIKKTKSILNEKNIDAQNSDKEITHISRKIDILNFWKQAFSDSGIKSIILDESIPVLNSVSSEFQDMIPQIRVSFDSQTTLKSGDQRNKFSVNVLQTNNLSNAHQLSAGEERIVNIIVLLCLRKLLETMQGVKLNILLFDEALEHLDPENTEIALHMIRKLSKDYFVSLISHTLRNNVECDEFLTL